MATFQFIQWLMDWILNQPHFKFDWDTGNLTKNLKKHGVSCQEAESVFKKKQSIRILGFQMTPKVDEPRYGIFGLTNNREAVFLCFTIRENKIRVIHIRKLNEKERSIYGKLCQK